jgi:acylphosphatase
LGLSGWVRNTKDGHVEAVACGNEDNLNQFTEWCRKGPTMARVEALEVRPADEEHAQEFRIIK